MSNPQQHPAAFFHPFEDWSDGDNQFFGLCVQKRAITTVLPDSGDWQEYHINYMGGGIYEIEYCPSEVTGTDQPQYRGKIPTREFFEALINSMEYPLPAGWAWKDPAPGHPEVPLDYETPARPRPRYVNLKDKLAAQDDAAPMEDRWDYDHGPDHMREVSESRVNVKSGGTAPMDSNSVETEKLVSGCSPTSCSAFFIVLGEAGTCSLSWGQQVAFVWLAIGVCVALAAVSVLLWPPPHWNSDKNDREGSDRNHNE